MEYRKDLVSLTFMSIDKLPLPLLYFLQELRRIEEGEINPISFNKRKKDAHKLINNWIDLAGGLMFERYLFEFEDEFSRFSQKLYTEILSFEKKFNEKKQKKIITSAGRFLKRIKELPVISEIFIICIFHEENLEEELLSKELSLKNHWSSIKDIYGITPEFEESLRIAEEDSDYQDNFCKWINEFYIITSDGTPIHKSKFN